MGSTGSFFTGSLTHADEVQSWLHTNDLENCFVIVHPLPENGGSNKNAVPDASIYRAYTVTEDTSEDATAQFSLDHRDFPADSTSIPQSVLDKYLVSSLPPHLTRSDDQPQLDIHVVISVASGTRRAYQFFHLVLKELLTALGLPSSSYVIYHTTSPESVTEYTQQTILPTASAGLRQTILLLSGDGGIFDIINVLLADEKSNATYVKPVIGLLPLGTGNALANSSGLNRDNTRGFLSFMKGSPHPVPVFATEFSPGSVFVVDEARATEAIPKNEAGNPTVYGGMVCSWGLHASLVADSDTEAYRKFGAERFQMAAKALLHPEDGSLPHVYRGRITTLQSNRAIGTLHMPLKPGEDESKSSEHHYVLATMVSNLEKSLVISPESKPLEGKMRLLHWGPVKAEETMEILGKAFDGGKHVGNGVVDERVLYKEVEGLRIEMQEKQDQWRRICVDGKIVLVGEGGWVEVRRELRRCIDLVA